jgi:hypothetical protein
MQGLVIPQRRDRHALIIYLWHAGLGCQQFNPEKLMPSTIPVSASPESPLIRQVQQLERVVHWMMQIAIQYVFAYRYFCTVFIRAALNSRNKKAVRGRNGCSSGLAHFARQWTLSPNTKRIKGLRTERTSNHGTTASTRQPKVRYGRRL